MKCLPCEFNGLDSNFTQKNHSRKALYSAEREKFILEEEEEEEKKLTHSFFTKCSFANQSTATMAISPESANKS